MLKQHKTRSLLSLLKLFAALVFFCFSMTCYAELSKEDAQLISVINSKMQFISGSGITIAIKDGNITLRGIASSNDMASNVITTIVSTPGVKNINTNPLTLPNGSRISRQALIIGLSRGYLLRNKLFGNNVTTISEMPIRMTTDNGIIYIDGMVNNLYIMSTTITTTMQVTSRIDRNIRIISRMTIRKVTVRMP